LLRWLGGDIPRGGAEIAPAFCLCVFRLHQSRGRRSCSGRLVVASLEETWGLLSRFDCVYSGYITQGCAGGALVGCYEPTCQMLLFPYTHQRNHQSRGRRLSRGALCRDRTRGHDMMEVMGSELQLGEEGGRRGQAMHCLHLPVEMTCAYHVVRGVILWSMGENG